jgi:hypothetical protein
LVVEKVLIIGKTQPDWAKREGDLVSCTVGITKRFEWRRLRHARLSMVRKLRIFTWAEMDIVRPKGANRDPRPESREFNPVNPRPIRVLYQISDVDVRRWYVEHCVQPSIAHMQRRKRTLGIVRPVDLEFTIGKPTKKEDEENQSTLLDWLAVDDPKMEYLRRQIDWKRTYAKKNIEVRFQFRCGSECEVKKKHDMKMLDIELFMLYNNCSSRRQTFEATIDCMASRIEKEHRNKDIFLGVGTHRRYPFKSYMVGSAMRFLKGLTPQQPLEIW